MLRFTFCPNERFNTNLLSQTKAYIDAMILDAELDQEHYNPDSLLACLMTIAPEITPVVVLCDKYGQYPGLDLAVRLRMVSRDAYLIYLSGGIGDLKSLTNHHLRISGYMTYEADISEYTHVIGNIVRDYMGRLIPESERFVLAIGKQIQIFPFREIIYFESLNKKVYLNTLTSQIDFYESLTSLEKRLEHRFIRCHNSFLVNSQHIKKISLKDQLITLTGNVTIKVSETYRKKVLDLIDEYRNQYAGM